MTNQEKRRLKFDVLGIGLGAVIAEAIDSTRHHRSFSLIWFAVYFIAALVVIYGLNKLLWRPR